MKLLKTIIILAVIVLFPLEAMAQVTPPSFWKRVGEYLQPIKSTDKVKTSQICFTGDNSCLSTAGGSLTPWTSNINGATYNLFNVGQIITGTSTTDATDTMTLYDTQDAILHFKGWEGYEENGGTEYQIKDNGNTLYFESLHDDESGPTPNFSFTNATNGWLFDLYRDGTFHFYGDADETSIIDSNLDVAGAISSSGEIEAVNFYASDSSATSTFTNAHVTGDLLVDGMFYAPIAVTVSGDVDMGTHDITNADTINATTLNSPILTTGEPYLQLGEGPLPVYVTGSIGIATDTPQTALDIFGDGANTGGISLGSGAGSLPYYIANWGTELAFSGFNGGRFDFFLDKDGEDEQNVLSLQQTGSSFGSDLTVTGTVSATGGSSTDWNTAYGWGNHANAGYQLASNAWATTSTDYWATTKGYLTSLTPWTSNVNGGGYALLGVASSTVTATSTTGALEFTIAGTGIKFQDGTYLRTAPTGGGASTTLLADTNSWSGTTNTFTNYATINNILARTYGTNSTYLCNGCSPNASADYGTSIGYQTNIGASDYNLWVGSNKAGGTFVGGGDSNVAVGVNDNSDNNAGAQRNTWVGAYFTSPYGGDDNSYFGYGTGQYGGKKDRNTLIGTQAGAGYAFRQTVTDNTIVGYYGGGSDGGQGGANGYNTLIGANTHIPNVGIQDRSDYSYNVLVGESATIPTPSVHSDTKYAIGIGRSASIAGHQSIALGSSATTGKWATSSVAIGYSADAPNPLTLILGEAGDTANSLNVGIGTTTPIGKLSVYTTGTTTVSVDSNSATKGACLVLKDSDGVGYTYVTANDGVLSASTVSCR